MSFARFCRRIRFMALEYKYLASIEAHMEDYCCQSDLYDFKSFLPLLNIASLRHLRLHHLKWPQAYEGKKKYFIAGYKPSCLRSLDITESELSWRTLSILLTCSKPESLESFTYNHSYVWPRMKRGPGFAAYTPRSLVQLLIDRAGESLRRLR